MSAKVGPLGMLFLSELESMLDINTADQEALLDRYPDGEALGFVGRCIERDARLRAAINGAKSAELEADDG